MHPRVAWISNHLVRLPLQRAPTFLGRIIKHCAKTRRKVWYGCDGEAYLPRDSALWRKLVPTPVQGEKVCTRCGSPAFASSHWRISARAASLELITSYTCMNMLASKWGGRACKRLDELRAVGVPLIAATVHRLPSHD
jgi:hypothetical protein